MVGQQILFTLYFDAVFESEIWDPGWTKIRIRDPR
jgi:hypothetical protein